MADTEDTRPLWLLKDKLETVIDTPGRKIQWRSQAFRLTDEERLAGVAAGPPAWSIRLKRIEDWHHNTEHYLAEKAAELLEALGNNPRFDARWERLVGGLRIQQVNALIDNHNRYYPIEARLPIDVKTHKMMDRDQPYRPMEPVTVEGLKRRYTSDWARQIALTKLGRSTKAERSAGPKRSAS